MCGCLKQEFQEKEADFSVMKLAERYAYRICSDYTKTIGKGGEKQKLPAKVDGGATRCGAKFPKYYYVFGLDFTCYLICYLYVNCNLTWA